MKKRKTLKIGIPDWLKELIQKGKYSYDNSSNHTDDQSYLFIEGNKLHTKKILKVRESDTIPESEFPLITKRINKRLYIFDHKKQLIIIEDQHD